MILSRCLCFGMLFPHNTWSRDIIGRDLRNHQLNILAQMAQPNFHHRQCKSSRKSAPCQGHTRLPSLRSDKRIFWTLSDVTTVIGQGMRTSGRPLQSPCASQMSIVVGFVQIPNAFWDLVRFMKDTTSLENATPTVLSNFSLWVDSLRFFLLQFEFQGSRSASSLGSTKSSSGC